MVHTLKDVIALAGVDYLSASLSDVAVSVAVLTTPSDTPGSSGLAATPPFVISITDRYGNQELMLVTVVNTLTRVLTVTRDLDGAGAWPFDAGTKVTMVVSRDTWLSFRGGVPTTEAFGDVASAGSSYAWARDDHLHGMPSAPGGSGLVLLVDDDTEASTSSASYADIRTVAVSPADNADLLILANFRTAGSFSGAAAAGCKANSTQLCASSIAVASGAVGSGLLSVLLGRYDGSYGAGAVVMARTPSGVQQAQATVAARPSSITSIVLGGAVPSGGTLYVKGVRVYGYPTS